LEERISEVMNFEEVSKVEYENEKAQFLNKLYENINIITDVTINENYTFPVYMAKIKEYFKEINEILNNKTNKQIYESLSDKNNPIEIYAVNYIGLFNYDSFEIRKKEESNDNIFKEMGAKKQRKIIFPKKFFDIKNEKRIKI
jgi:hypothetical protein